jgi:hypothetical protein
MDTPLANLFVRAVKPSSPEARGVERVRSASEAFLYRRLELAAFPCRILGNNLGNKSFKKPQKLPKSPANGLTTSRSFSFAESNGCEEF